MMRPACSAASTIELVAGATADVAGNCVAYIGLSGAGRLGQKRGKRYQHARGAKAALQAVIVAEGLLNRMQLTVW